MALGPGTRLGAYEVLSLLGSGGMGEVWRARDVKLQRHVAIKVLAQSLRDDPQRLARFEREAKMLAALSHRNIALVHGFEDSTDMPALVMELVEGPTLADRLAKGPIPLDEALPIAKQIAEGLEAAHEQGIIHRDLKPANIKVRDDGTVKILDFGLAKALEPRQPIDANTTQSPTMTTPEMMTRVGVILGTAAYMSPEQASGRPADRQSDVWAFGCVLYEMLTGRRAFSGESAPEVFSHILAAEPDWHLLPQGTPASVQRVLRRCLQKNAPRRLRAIGDALFDLDENTDIEATNSHTSGVSRPLRVVSMAAATLVIGIGIGRWLTTSAPADTAETMRGQFSVALPADAPLVKLDTPAMAVSPDGRRLAFTAGDTIPRLFVRDLDSAQMRVISGTEGASSPFFSPDGRSIGFFAGGDVKRVSVDGGNVTTLCATASNPRGGAWNTDGTIAFTPAPGSAVFRVSADGGDPQPLTTLDVRRGEGAHHWPEFIPEAGAILYTAGVGTAASWDDREIVVESLRTHERRVVARGTAARYLTAGQLMIARGGSLLTVPFDVKRFQTTGPATRVADGVMQSAFGAAQFGVSRTGTFAYVPGTISQRELVWVSRSGAATTLTTPPQTYWSVRLSPDGQRLALGIEGPTYGVWIYDLARETLTRETFEGTSAYPIWTPDGKRLTFNSTKSGGVLNLFWRPADGSGEEERLATSSRIQIANSWAPDGRTLAYQDNGERTGRDIWMLSLDRDRRVWPFAATPYQEGGAAFSPDGRRVAYVSTEGGAQNVFLRSFPGPGEKLQVSNDGGGGPAWSGDGRELFYRAGDRMMVVAVDPGGALKASKARELFRIPALSTTLFQADYDVTRDGQRFIMIRPRGEPPQITHVAIIVHGTGRT